MRKLTEDEVANSYYLLGVLEQTRLLVGILLENIKDVDAGIHKQLYTPIMQAVGFMEDAKTAMDKVVDDLLADLVKQETEDEVLEDGDDLDVN